MRRVLLFFVLALAGCSPPAPTSMSEPPDAGSTIALDVLDQQPIIVVRGSSATTRIGVSDAFHTPLGHALTIAPGPLPEGITATSATWDNGPATVSITFTAASDAPEAELPIEIRAFANGDITSSTTAIVAVSDVVGSLDATYGQSGCVFLPGGSANPSAIRI
ncbi:MAG TPA: hypothetical protein VGH87_17060, partial [Polyangiaceae bacterium]